MNEKLKNYILFSFIILVLILLAFIGFKSWSIFVLSNLIDIKTFSSIFLYLFAFFAGLITFFAPCATGILPAYISYYLNLEDSKEKDGRLKRSIYLGSIAASGIMSLYLVIGIALTIFGSSLATYFTLSKPIIAIILVIIGIALYINYSFKTNYIFNFINNLIKAERAKRSLFFFGILYGASALGCALLVFIPLVVLPFSTNFLTSLITFIIYAGSIGISMIITTVLIAFSKDILIKETIFIHRLKKITGIILILSGIYLSYYYIRFGM